MVKDKKITIVKKLRPIRLAFLVNKEDKRTLHEVFRINTCLWGGIYNLIIPFFRKTPKNWENHRFKLPSASSILKGYLDSFDTDYVVVRDKKILSDSLFDKERLLSFEEVLNIKDEYPISFGVDVTDLYWYLYDKEFKFERRHQIKVIYPKPLKEIALLSACCFGEFPPLKEMEYIKKNYSYYFNPQDININTANFLNCFINEGASPLRITRAELHSSSRGWRADPSVFLMDAKSWLDIIDYWNLRAVGRDVLPLPKQYADNYIDLCNKVVKQNYVPDRYNKNMMHHTNFICSRSSTMQEMEAFSKKLTLPGQDAVLLQHWYPRMWDEWAKDKDNVELCSVKVAEKTEESSIDDGYIKFKDISPKFVDKYGGNGKPRWMNIIRFKDYYKQFDCPSVVPRNLKDAYHVFGAHGLNHIWTSGEGINIPCKHFEWSHFWTVPTNLKIFEAWFKERGFDIILSGSGRILLKIIDSVDGIQGTRIFQDEEIIKLLNKMSHNVVEIEVEESFDQSFKSKVRAKTVPIESWRGLLMKLNRNSAEVAKRHLQNMINYKIIKCGINIQCPECMQHTWYTLDDLSDEITCERCLERFDFPVVKPVPESAWHFRTIGPFSVENYAQGGYCVALALRFFADHNLSNEMTWIPSFIIKGKDSTVIEADFGIFLSQGRLDEIKPPIVIFGECKSYNEFNDKDIDRMKQMANNFPGSIIAFCTLRSSLTNREKKLIAKFARKGRNYYKAEQWINPILVLTGIELFSNNEPPYCWEDKGKPYSDYVDKYRRIGDIQELCDVAQQMHLGVESYWDWYEQQRQKRLKRRTEKNK